MFNVVVLVVSMVVLVVLVVSVGRAKPAVAGDAAAEDPKADADAGVRSEPSGGGFPRGDDDEDADDSGVAPPSRGDPATSAFTGESLLEVGYENEPDVFLICVGCWVMLVDRDSGGSGRERFGGGVVVVVELWWERSDR